MLKFNFLILLFLPVTLWAQLPGNSIQIKANTTYVSIPDAASNSLNDTITIEAWVYYLCANGTAGAPILMKGWCGSTWSLGLSIDEQKIRFNRIKPVAWSTTNCNTANTVIFETDGQEVPFNTWTHIAVVVSGTNVVMYVNGQTVSSSVVSGTNNLAGFKTSTEPLRIGTTRSLSNAYTSFKGHLDEIRLWHKERSQAEIMADMNQELIGNESGLYAYWKLNESGSGAGISVINSATATGAAYNGTTTGTAANLQFRPNNEIQDQLPTCDPVLWLMADSAVTYNVSNQVSQWNDLSGFNHHVTQSNSTNMPIYQPNVINTKPALYFDGVNGKHFLNNTIANPVNSGTARTVFVAGRRDCQPHGNGLIGGTLFTFRRSGLINTLTYGANSAGLPVYIYSDNNGIGNNNATISASVIDTAIQNFLITYKIPAAGSQVQCRLNKQNQVVDQGSGSVTAETGATGFTVGDREDQPDLDWSGWIYEVIVFNRSLTNNEIIQVENYLRSKYPQSPNVFNAVHTNTQQFNNALMDDGLWVHSYHDADINKIIASVKDDCLDMGSRSDTVYVDATAGTYFGSKYMRRHYVIQPSLNPAGTKRVRLYYTNADFADLQSHVSGLVSHNQLCVTKYDGANEDGIYDPAGGTSQLIPSGQITTGTAFGQRYLEFDVNGLSEFWIHAFNIALPVQIVSFEASLEQPAQVRLEWQTTQEMNVRHYEIERSTDARQFERIASIDSRGNQALGHQYSYLDVHPVKGINHYRLKSIDIDNQFAYSEIRHVRIEDGQFDVTVYPSNSDDGIFHFQSDRKVDVIHIYSAMGQLMKHVYPDLSDQLDLSMWPSGLYLLEFHAGNMLSRKKASIR